MMMLMRAKQKGGYRDDGDGANGVVYDGGEHSAHETHPPLVERGWARTP